MGLRRIIKNISVLILLMTLHVPDNGFFVKAEANAGSFSFNTRDPYTRDTVRIDTTGKLPFPFKDQPAFGFPDRQDTSSLYLKRPENLNFQVEYDPVTGQYIFYEKIGKLNYRLPQTMSLKDYVNFDFKKSVQEYWLQRQNFKETEKRNSLIPRLTIQSEAFNRIFGGNTINVKPQGFVEVSFGYQMNSTDNPAIPERLRKVPTFDFNQKIQMNVMGEIGTKMKMRVNYNTEATFDYENKMNLEYTGDEDEIIKRIEAGNVSLPLNGSLITGASNLFGVKSEMQFGKLTLTTLFSQHKGETNVVETEGGAQVTEFEVSAADYDANRHFFLSQYFRDHYDEALRSLPVIRSGVTINKIEVWVTNKSSNFTEARNILALQDLGEHNPHIYNTIPAFQQTTGQTGPERIYPNNDANGLYREMTTTYSAIRDIQSITSVMAQFGNQFMGGRDFDKIEQARKLTPSDYTVNLQLGYISLNTSLNSDEVLAVAFNYTVNGQVYQVGEFSTDGVDAPRTLVLKLIKGTNLTPKIPTWKLMMKNIYNLNAYQLSKDNFMLNVMFMNDSTGTYINYIPAGRINGHILLNVMNLDNLNKQQDPNKDGIFDFIEGYTVNSSSGRIIFPVLEPFGKHLADSLGNPALTSKYVYQSLYDSTKTVAEQDAEHNKFRLTGSYKGSSSSDISVGAFNLAQGSVKVTAGGRELTENVDYTVDYTLGRVSIINPGLLESGTPISVSTESQDLFSMQRKTLLGAHANYAISDRFNLGATALFMQERPLTQKVDYGQDPISNLMLGLDASFSSESRFLTKLIDKLPFISTKTPSTINFEGEFAQLIPGHSRVIQKSGTAYIDDFEGTSTSIDMKTRQSWVLASTPQHQSLFPEGNLSNNTNYGFNRALLSWYIIDPLFLRSSSLTPSHIKNDKNLQSNHLVREVFEQEIFPDKESVVGEPTNISVLDLAFYPNEKGPYNFDTRPSSLSAGVNADGTLRNPESRWGGIMRKIENSDFETANIEFIEFWLMDPYVNDTLNIPKGGDLYFNLGDISEDILRDSRKSFENGLPTTPAVTNLDTTIWGRVSTQQSLVNAFDNNTGSRVYQDLGFDGLNDKDESTFFSSYLNDLKNVVTPDVYKTFESDPSKDDYHYYRGTDYDQAELGILERYKKFNGPDGNSPTTEMSPESYSTSASTLPDVEDINNDNTLNEYERYYQYRVSLRKQDMILGKNYINNIKQSRVQLKNGQIGQVKWYQFKIPVRQYDNVFGNISDFKSIRFMRVYLRDFEEPVVLRFATLDLVRSDWRRYTQTLKDPGVLAGNASFDISAVNVEENGSKDPVNYILPPGIDRVIDPANPQLRQLNEQSMVLKVNNLEQGDARAAYKSIYMDFRRYKRMRMEVHAEEMPGYPLQDNELTFFVRMGTDYNYNYYEYELPLKLTDPGRYNGEILADRFKVWPDENRINVPLDLFTNLKLDRDAAMRKAGSNLRIQDIYEEVHRDWNDDKNLVRIKGSPNLGNIQVMMIGIRNKKKQVNTGAKSVEVWVNELRLTDFDESGGWAANARVTARLADLGTITIAGRTRSAGFGSIQEKVNQRSLDNLQEIDIASSVDLGRFFPKESGVNIPMYYGYSRSNTTPRYDPLNPDIELKKSLSNLDNKADRDSVRNLSQDLVVRKSINFTNIKFDPQSENPKPPKLWSPGNFAFTYSYNEIFKRNVNTEYNIDKIYRGMISYNFSTRPKLISPLSKVKFLQKGPLKLLGGLNFYPLPSQISFRTDLYRRYNEIQTRNITNPLLILPKTFEKDFIWNRFFDLRYDFTQNLKFDFSSRNTSRIDEPEGSLNRRNDDYEWKRDSIVSNIMSLGRPVLYNHNIDITYTLPINQIKALSFVNVMGRYEGTYNWEAGAMTSDSIKLGNLIENSQNLQLTGNINLTSIYNMIPYLRKLDEKFQNTGRSRYGGGRMQTGSTTGRRLPQQEPRMPVKPPRPEYSKENVSLSSRFPVKITHNLNVTEITVKVTDAKGKAIAVTTKNIDKNNVELTSSDSVASAKVLVIGKSEKNILKEILDVTLRMATGVRNLSVNMSTSGGSVMPGYLPEPAFIGGGRFTPDVDMFGKAIASSYSPGLPFLLGWQDRKFAQSAGEHGWLTTDPLLNLPFQFNSNTRINIRADMEPLPDLRIDVDADRSMSKNLSEFYNYDQSLGSFKAQNLTEKGNFSMSVLTWSTAFFAIGKEEVKQSQAFENLKDYRRIISERLAAQRPANMGYDPNGIDPKTGYPDGYGPTSVEVLVPAFLAAYQGINPHKVSLGLFPSIKYIRPNWRIQYEGIISKIPGINKLIKSLNFTHAYRSSYTVGSFLTNLNYSAMDDGFSYIRDIQNNFLPSYEFNAVSINETFSPLLNVDITWVNDLTTKAEIKRSRSMALSFANNQLTEVLSNEYVFGVGYRFNRMDLILKTKNSQQSYSNDLTIRADLSFRKNKTVLRRLVEDTDQLTAGQNAVTIKTTADYMLSDRFQLRLYFDKVINQPFVGSFDTSNTNFGVSFKFTLAQ
jgi:cell surface protein SprA